MKLIQNMIIAQRQEGKKMTDRKYVAISIKHTAYLWKYGMPCILWGWKRTADEEKRCFSGYTMYVSKAELYSVSEFIDKYGSVYMKDEPVPMTPDLCKRWKHYDSVLALESDYRRYCVQNFLATEPPKRDEEAII